MVEERRLMRAEVDVVARDFIKGVGSEPWRVNLCMHLTSGYRASIPGRPASE